MQRNDWANFQTNFADKFLPGQAFTITSDWIPVKQNNANFFDWFNNKSSTDRGSEISKSSTATNEIQKSGTMTNEVKK